MSEKRRIPYGWITLIIGALIAFFVFSGDENERTYYPSYPNSRSIDYEEDNIISRDDAIYYHWDEIKDYVSGTETIDACSLSSGNCYGLDADISNGAVETIYFPSGGYLYFSADIDENGNASDFDQNGDSWDFTIDMDSLIIDDAIYDWAYDNGYEIE